MDETVKIIARIRLEKAKDDVTVAPNLFDQGKYRQAISRAYYAVFAIASAALLTQQVKRKKHSGVESAFHRYLVKPKLIEQEYAVIYSRAYKARQDTDYLDTTDFTAERAKLAVIDAERFVSRIEKFLYDINAIA